MTTPSPDDDWRVRRGPPGPPPVVWAMTALFAGFEIAFQLADEGILPWPDLRFEVYVRMAFWDIYFEEALAGRAVPPEFWSSFLTHGLLHGSMVHLLMNGVIFLSVGGMLANGLGAVRFVALFAVTAMTGALFFGVIADTQGPLVGASGAIFGFFGALKRWEWRYIRETGAPANRFWGTIGALILLNVVLFFFMPGEGSLAWEAHLGGFVAGFLVAPVLAPHARGPSPI